MAKLVGCQWNRLYQGFELGFFAFGQAFCQASLSRGAAGQVRWRREGASTPLVIAL